MRTITTIATVAAAAAALVLSAAGCAKNPAKMTVAEKVATLPAKIQPLFKSWKLDVNASAAKNSKAVKDTTGITADIQFKGDVGKAAQFAARTLTFTFEKESLKRVYAEKYGEGLLSTQSTGWLTVDDELKGFTFKNPQGKETSYKIDEITADKLVISPQGGGAWEVYNAK